MIVPVFLIAGIVNLIAVNLNYNITPQKTHDMDIRVRRQIDYPTSMELERANELDIPVAENYILLDKLTRKKDRIKTKRDLSYSYGNNGIEDKEYLNKEKKTVIQKGYNLLIAAISPKRRSRKLSEVNTNYINENGYNGNRNNGVYNNDQTQTSYNNNSHNGFDNSVYFVHQNGTTSFRNGKYIDTNTALNSLPTQNLYHRPMNNSTSTINGVSNTFSPYNRSLNMPYPYNGIYNRTTPISYNDLNMYRFYNQAPYPQNNVNNNPTPYDGNYKPAVPNNGYNPVTLSPYNGNYNPYPYPYNGNYNLPSPYSGHLHPTTPNNGKYNLPSPYSGNFNPQNNINYNIPNPYSGFNGVTPNYGNYNPVIPSNGNYNMPTQNSGFYNQLPPNNGFYNQPTQNNGFYNQPSPNNGNFTTLTPNNGNGTNGNVFRDTQNRTTTERVIAQSCILCSTFKCPKGQTWRGFRCADDSYDDY